MYFKGTQYISQTKCKIDRIKGPKVVMIKYNFIPAECHSFIFFKDLVLYLKELHRRRKEAAEVFICWFTLQITVIKKRLGHAKASSFIQVSHVGNGPVHLGQLLLLSWVSVRELDQGMEQIGHKLAPLWGVAFASIDFSYCTTMPDTKQNSKIGTEWSWCSTG